MFCQDIHGGQSQHNKFADYSTRVFESSFDNFLGNMPKKASIYFLPLSDLLYSSLHKIAFLLPQEGKLFYEELINNGSFLEED